MSGERGATVFTFDREHSVKEVAGITVPVSGVRENQWGAIAIIAATDLPKEAWPGFGIEDTERGPCPDVIPVSSLVEGHLAEVATSTHAEVVPILRAGTG